MYQTFSHGLSYSCCVLHHHQRVSHANEPLAGAFKLDYYSAILSLYVQILGSLRKLPGTIKKCLHLTDTIEYHGVSLYPRADTNAALNS